MRTTYNRLPLWGKAAITTGMNLFGGMLLGLAGGIAIPRVPLHLPRIDENLVAAVFAIVMLFLGGRRWIGRILRLTGFQPQPRHGVIGGLSFAGAIIGAGLSLAGLEGILAELGLGPDLPIHVLFTVLFVPATFIVVALVSIILGASIRGVRTGVSLAIRSAPVAALAFLLVNVGMDRIGYRVGAPRAEERATMITVMLAGSLGASLGGGAALGSALAGTSREDEPPAVEYRRSELGYSDG